MKYGLTDQQLEVLREKLFSPLKKLGAEVYIFGSRARGNQQRFSDIDILVVASSDLSRKISAITEEFESSNFPYKIDIVEERSLAESYRSSVLADRIRM